jgi:hypothetical protein
MEVLVSDGFRLWYEGLEEADRDAVYRAMGVIEAKGNEAGEPCSFVDGVPVEARRFSACRQLEAQVADHLVRLLFFFHPIKRAMFVFGGERAAAGETR